MPYSEWLERLLGEPTGVLAEVSGNRAAIRVAHAGGDLSNTAIIQLKKGRFGRGGDSLRKLARAYAEEIRLHPVAREAEPGPLPAEPEAVADWVVAQAFADAGITAPGEAEPGTLDVDALAAALEQRVSAAILRQIGDLVKPRRIDESAAQYYVRRLAELNEQYGRAVRVNFNGGLGRLTDDNVEAYVADLEDALREREARKKPEG